MVTNAGLASHLDPTLLQPADPDAPGLGQSPSPISLQGNAPPRDHDRFVSSICNAHNWKVASLYFQIEQIERCLVLKTKELKD